MAKRAKRKTAANTGKKGGKARKGGKKRSTRRKKSAARKTMSTVPRVPRRPTE
jgi:hypothetical protein